MGSPGVVYILHNCGLREGLLKIGLTTRTAEVRAAELTTTGVPQKFLVLFSQLVSDADEVEDRLHAKFAEYRYNDEREFFFVSPSRAISALLEEAGALAKEFPKDREYEEVLPSLMKMYGSLLDPSLKTVVIETGDEVPTSLVCSVSRGGDEVLLRRDMDFVAGKSGPYFASAKKAAVAARLLVALDPYTLATVTPLFSQRGAQLIADMHERTKLDVQAIKTIADDATAKCQGSTLDAIEAQIRSKLDLPVHSLQVVSVNEYDGHFVLSINKESEPLRNLRISTDDDYDYRDPVSYAVVTRSVVDELDHFDAIDIGYRCSPATWTSDGPRIRIEGRNSAGIPFEQFFSFLP